MKLFTLLNLFRYYNNIKSNILLENENIKNNFINIVLAGIYTVSDIKIELDFIEDEAIIKIVEETNNIDAPMQNKIEYVFSLFRKEVLSAQIDHKNNVRGKRKI